MTHVKIWSQRSAFGVPQAILKSGTVLMNLTEVTAGSRKEGQRQTEDNIERVEGHQGSFLIATDYGLHLIRFLLFRPADSTPITEKELNLNSEDLSLRAESITYDLDQSQVL